MAFLKLQRIFKLFVASTLGIINTIAFFMLVSLTEKSIVCSAIASNAPEQLSKPITINLVGIIDIIVNFLTRIIQYAYNTIVFLFHGHQFIHIPMLHLPAGNLVLPASPIQIIPFLSNPNNILSLCNYANVGMGIASAVIITAVLSAITTTIVTSDIPKQFAKFINRRLANKVVKLMDKMIVLIEKIEPSLLDNPSLERAINHAKSVIDAKKLNSDD
jgi:hypothetical protein